MDNMEMEQKVKDLAGDLGYQTDRDLGAAGLDRLRRAGRVRKRRQVWAIACAAVVLVGAGILLPLILYRDAGYHGQELTIEYAEQIASIAVFNQTYHTNYLSLSGAAETESVQAMIYEILETGEFAYLEENSTVMTEVSYSYSTLEVRLAEVNVLTMEEWKGKCDQNIQVGKTDVSFSQAYSESDSGYISYASWVYDGVEYALRHFSLTEQDFFDELNRLLGQVEASA